jgi:hypothetical protein
MSAQPTQLLLFAHPKELLGTGTLTVPFTPTLAALRLYLQAAYPALCAALPSCSFAVAEVLVPLEAEASTATPAVAALIPPVSGG